MASAAGNSSKSSAISQYNSIDQVAEIILEENKKRCDFFKFYKFDETDKIGSVSN